MDIKIQGDLKWKYQKATGNFIEKNSCLARELYVTFEYEYIALRSAENKNASEKFWELEKRIKEDKRHPGVIIEMSKSDAIYDIVRLIRLDVITYADLTDFSEDLQQAVKILLDR